MTTRTRFNHRAATSNLPAAVRSNDIPRAESILQQSDIDLVNLPDATGETPLFIASRSGQLNMLSLLLEYNKSAIDWAFADGTMMGAAAARGDVQTLRRLADHGASLDGKGNDGNTPLMRAWAAKNFDALQTLLHMGADIAAENSEHKNILHLAAEANDAAALDILIAQRGALHVQNAMSAGEKMTPLHAAVKAGAEDAVQALIAAGANVNAPDGKNRTALQTAAEMGHAGIVLTLVAVGHADVNTMNDSPEGTYAPMHLAAIGKHENVMRLLIDLGADPHQVDKQKRTPLNICAWNGHLEGVKLLLDETPAETNAEDAALSRAHALYDALFYAHDDVADHMLDSGKVDMNIRVHGTENMLNAALQGGRSDMAAKVIAAGAEVNITNRQDFSPLLLCAQRNMMAAAALLLKSGANPNMPGTSEPPLHAAIGANDSPMVTLLLAHGANPHMQDRFGRCALDVARQRGQAEMIPALEIAAKNFKAMEKITPPPTPQS